MKYTNEVVINAPREKVIELFDNPDNLKEWQPGLVSFEHISGEAGMPGAKSRILYKMGKREIEMIETITERNLPDVFAGTYEARGVKNWIANRFEEVEGNRTRMVTESEFKFSGFMKLMGLLMPGAFRKQSQQFLEQFREFVEKN